MAVTRRQFLKICAGTGAAFSLSGSLVPEIVAALEKAAAGNPPVLWIQGAMCTGCSTSLLNSVHPSIAEVLLEIISLKFHGTVMAASGDKAFDYLWESAAKNYGKYFLVVEGAVQTVNQGKCCLTGEREGKEVTFTELTKYLAKGAAGVVAVGQCATYGGIPAAHPNPTRALGVGGFLKDNDIKTPVINVPGCPAHPDWIVGTVAHTLMFGIPELDSDGRPTLFYGTLVHDNCPYRSYYEGEKFAKSFGEAGCRVELGCKGPETHSDCWKRGWNGNVNWCLQNAICIGCTQPGFPDYFSPFYVKTTG
jgi:hydrogenase small subunit